MTEHGWTRQAVAGRAEARHQGQGIGHYSLPFSCRDSRSNFSGMADVFSSMLAGLSEAGMTTVEVARRSGVSRQHLYRIKNGECRNPSYDTYKRLDRVYQSTVPAAKKIARNSRV